MPRVSHNRLRFLPISLALGLFVGDGMALLLGGDLTLGRAAVSALISVVVYSTARWLVGRRAHHG